MTDTETAAPTNEPDTYGVGEPYDMDEVLAALAALTIESPNLAIVLDHVRIQLEYLAELGEHVENLYRSVAPMVEQIAAGGPAAMLGMLGAMRG